MKSVILILLTVLLSVLGCTSEEESTGGGGCEVTTGSQRICTSYTAELPQESLEAAQTACPGTWLDKGCAETAADGWCALGTGESMVTTYYYGYEGAAEAALEQACSGTWTAGEGAEASADPSEDPSTPDPSSDPADPDQSADSVDPETSNDQALPDQSEDPATADPTTDTPVPTGERTVLDAGGSPAWRAVPVGRWPSIALDAEGKVYVAYQEWKKDSPDAADHLRFITNKSGSWQSALVDGGNSTGYGTSIVVTAAGTAFIAYLDDARDTAVVANNESGSWEKEDVGATGSVPAASKNTALVLDGNGMLHLLFATKTGIQHATRGTDGEWTTEEVVALSHGGYAVAADADGQGKLHLCYTDIGASKLTYATNTSGAWASEFVDQTLYAGSVNGLVVDGDSKVHLVYMGKSATDGEDAVLHLTNASGAWVPEDIHRFPAPRAALEYALGLAVDSTGALHTTYLDQAVGLIHSTNAGGAWVQETVEEDDTTGHVSALAIAADDKVHIVYHDRTGADLVYIVK